MKIAKFLLYITIFLAAPTACFGQDINPKDMNPWCISMINGSLADHPLIYEINMDICQKSNAAADIEEHNKKSNCSYDFSVIGKTTNGIYVLSTWNYCKDGTGRYSSLVLLRLEKKQIYDYDEKSNTFHYKQYNALVYLGELIGGDRETGSFHALKIEGNKLVGKRYLESNSPIGDGKSREITIDLSGIK